MDIFWNYTITKASINLLFRNYYLSGVKKFLATLTKQDLGTALRSSFQNFQQAHPSFLYGNSPLQ